MAVSQSVARPVRTGVQFLSAAVVVEFVDSFFLDFTDRQYAALVGLLTMVIGYVQVVVENRAGKAFLREPEPPARPVDVVEDAQPKGYASGVRPLPVDPGADPRPRGEHGAFDASILIAVAAVVVIVCGLIYIARAF